MLLNIGLAWWKFWKDFIFGLFCRLLNCLTYILIGRDLADLHWTLLFVHSCLLGIGKWVSFFLMLTCSLFIFIFIGLLGNAIEYWICLMEILKRLYLGLFCRLLNLWILTLLIYVIVASDLDLLVDLHSYLLGLGKLVRFFLVFTCFLGFVSRLLRNAVGFWPCLMEIPKRLIFIGFRIF